MAEETKKTGFRTLTGKVTVSAKDEPKVEAEISYPAFVVVDNQYPDFSDLAATLLSNGVVENFTPLTDEQKKQDVAKPISLTELLIEGFKRYSYTVAVGKAKERHNNSPAKTESTMAKELRALSENPDATEEQRERAKKMLAMLTA